MLGYLPRLSLMPVGRCYLLDRVALADRQLTYHYAWNTSAGEATSEREGAEEVSRR
jgi:hypothetical protein